VSLILALPFAIVQWTMVGISFGLLLVHFFLSTGSIVSFTFALIAIRPTQAMGRVMILGILMSFFVVYFWALFS
jgi:hypothetical protein